MKRAIALFLVFVALALVLAGCGGKAKERALTVADLASVIGPAPDTPTGATYQSNGDPTELGITDLHDRAATAADRATVALLENAGFNRLYRRHGVSLQGRGRCGGCVRGLTDVARAPDEARSEADGGRGERAR